MANPVSRLFLNNTKAPFSVIRTSLLAKSNVNIPKDLRRSLLSPASTMLDQIPNRGPVHQVPSFFIGTPLFGEESKWVLDKRCVKSVDYENGTGLKKFELAWRKKAYEEEDEGDFNDDDKDLYGRIGSSDDDDNWDEEVVDDDDGGEDVDYEDDDDERPRKK